MTSASSDPQQLGPIQAQERIVLLDVVRGFAILGMFYSNWGGRYHPDLSDLDHGFLQGSVDFIRGWLIVGKFWPLFGLLMGVGMGIQVGRADERGGDIVPIYLRRLIFLFLLGWFGSFFLGVSQLYALATVGFVTFFVGYVLRRHRTFLLAVIIWLFISDSIPTAIRMYTRESSEPLTAEQVEQNRIREGDLRRRLIEGYAEQQSEAMSVTSPFNDRELFQMRMDRFLENPVPRGFRSLGNLVTSDIELLIFMLIGFLVWQVGFFERVLRRRRLLIGVLGASVVIGLAEMSLYEIVIPIAQAGNPDARIPILEAVKPLLWILSPTGLDLAYISAFVLLFSFVRPARFLTKLAPAGRMAFTNYVLQWALPPILFPLLFGWWMPGITPAEMALKVTVVFILLVLFSTWWLKRFRFGPFEWLWRSLTYWKLQPMRVEKVEPTG